MQKCTYGEGRALFMPKAGRVRHAKINCSCRDERFELDISKARESSEKDTAGQRPAFESNKRMEEQRKADWPERAYFEGGMEEGEKDCLNKDMKVNFKIASSNKL